MDFLKFNNRAVHGAFGFRSDGVVAAPRREPVHRGEPNLLERGLEPKHRHLLPLHVLHVECMLFIALIVKERFNDIRSDSLFALAAVFTRNKMQVKNHLGNIRIYPCRAKL